MPFSRVLASAISILVSHAVYAQASDPEQVAAFDNARPAIMKSFSNPIVPAISPAGSADPSVVLHDGYYYYCKSLSDRAIGIAKARRLQDIGKAPMFEVWTAPRGTAYSKQVWAPELRYLSGKWYIYFAASDGDNATHRMYALELHAEDPQQPFVFKGKIAASNDQWAIDGTTLESNGHLYFVWSGWRNASDGFPQVTFIAPMSDPLTISGERSEIAAPDLAWERSGAALMEGHAVLYRKDKIYLVYSASASWTDDYALGMLTYSGGDILSPRSWSKAQRPVFSKQPEGGSFGPGHNTFVTSPDGKEDWIIYHAIDSSKGGWSRRSVRAQRFGWNPDDSPNFGSPVGVGIPIAEPSGTHAPDLIAPSERVTPSDQLTGLQMRHRLAARTQALESGESLADDLVHVVVPVSRQPTDEGHIVDALSL
jgi:GH43 family beta-xylosidase